MFPIVLMNLATIGLRGRSTGRMSGLYLDGAGALAIVASKVTPGLEQAAVWGVALTLAGSLLSVLNGESGRSNPSRRCPHGIGIHVVTPHTSQPLTSIVRWWDCAGFWADPTDPSRETRAAAAPVRSRPPPS
jgi:hypothetical protein